MSILCPHCHNDLTQPALSKALRGSSTATEKQEERILAALREGPKTSPQLQLICGAQQWTARIHNLREKGYDISTTLYNGIGNDGLYHVNLALYRLESEPDGTGEAQSTNPRKLAKAAGGRKGAVAGKTREAAKSGAGATDGGEAACQ